MTVCREGRERMEEGEKSKRRKKGSRKEKSQQLIILQDIPQNYLDAYLDTTMRLWKRQYGKTYIVGPVIKKEVYKYKTSYYDGTLFGIQKSGRREVGGGERKEAVI